MDSPAGEQCKHATEEGCSLWPNLPPGCKAFACMYRNADKVSVALKPDSCGVMFEQVDPKIVLGTMGTVLTKLVVGQIRAFNRIGLSVVLSMPGKRVKPVYSAPGVEQQDVTDRIEELIREVRDGRA